MQITTTIKVFVPSSIATNFRVELLQNGLTTSIEIEDEEFAHYDGGEIADIIVFIKEHATELVVTGLLAPLVYDVLKSAVSNMWKSLTKVSFRKEDKDEHTEKHISVRIEDSQKRVVIIEIKGDLSPEKIDEIVASAFANLEASKKETLFSNKDFVSSTKNQETVQLHYNSSTGIWEPYNFSELKKEWDELMRKIDDLES